MSPGYPRIRKRLGAIGIPLFQSTPTVDNQKDYDRCVHIFDRLVADEEIEVLNALMAGDVSWGELLYADRRGELSGTKIMAKVKLGRPLWQAIVETLPIMGKSENTRKLYGYMLRALERQTIVPWPSTPMRVRDLVKLNWVQLAEKWPNSASDWNHVVRAVRAFLTKYLGSTRHEFREQFGKLVPLVPEDERVPDITPERFREIMGELPAHAGAVAMGLLLTAFRDRSEFFRCDESNLMPATCQIRLKGKGTKTGRGRVIKIDEDLWPWIVASIPAPIGYLQFLRHWHRACVAVGAGKYVETGKMKRVRKKLERGQNYTRKGHRQVGERVHQVTFEEVPQLRYVGLRPHDLRHALAQWTHDEGMSLTRIKTVLGHRNIRTTQRYAESLDRGEVGASMGDVVKRRVLNQ
jgi:integrase